MGRRLILPIVLILLPAFQMMAGRGDITSYLQQLEKELAEGNPNVLDDLNGLDRDMLRTRSNIALYSLLKSQALDESGVFLTADTQISPALTYFSRRGSEDRKMRTYYYRGRIDENSGETSNAMEWFKQAEYFIDKNSDPCIAGRIFQHKAALYKELYDYKDALLNAQKASEFFLLSGSIEDYSANQIELSELQILLEDTSAATESINKLYNFWGELDSLTKAKCCTVLLRLAIEDGDKAHLEDVERHCLEEFPSRKNFPELSMSLAESSLNRKDLDKTANYLEEYSQNMPGDTPAAKYHVLVSKLLEAKGDYEGAYRAAQRYDKMVGSDTMGALGSDTKYIEERYEATIREMKMKERTNSILLTALIVIITLILLLRYMMVAMNVVRTELSSSQAKLKELQDEHQALKAVLDKSTIVDEKSRKMINERFALLDKVIVSHLSEDENLGNEAEREIDNIIREKNSFITSMALNMSDNYPDFSRDLKAAGLNEFEIGYCYLYVMGMQKKDIENFLSKRTIDTVTKSIRAKLDLEKDDVKLKTIILEKFKEHEKK